ncbi:MAG: hypothetical protein WC766_06025 [Patescibacteria group bacterium]
MAAVKPGRKTMSHHVLSVLYSIVGRRGALSLVTLLVTLLVALTAQTARADDNPYASEACVTTINPDKVIGDKHFSVITINKRLAHESPKTCSLRTAHQIHPIVVDGKQLDVESWLRSVYAANQSEHPTVLCRCVSRSGKVSQCSTGTDSFCSDGTVANIMGVPSNGWKAYILIPSTLMLTQEQRNIAAAKAACAEASGASAINACREAGLLLQTPGPAVPYVSDAEIFKKEMEASKAKVAEMTTRLAQMDEQLVETQKALAAARSDANSWLLGVVIEAIAYAVLNLVLAWYIWTKRKLAKELKKERAANEELNRANLELHAGLAKAGDFLKQQGLEHRKAMSRLENEARDEIRRLKDENKKLDQELNKTKNVLRNVNIDKATKEVEEIRQEIARLNLLRTGDVEVLSQRLSQIPGEAAALTQPSDRRADKMNKVIEFYSGELGDLIQGCAPDGYSLVPPAMDDMDQAKRLVAKIARLVADKEIELEALRQAAPLAVRPLNDNAASAADSASSAGAADSAPAGSPKDIDDATMIRAVDKVVDLLSHWFEALRRVAELETRIKTSQDVVRALKDPFNIPAVQSGLDAHRIELGDARKEENELSNKLNSLGANRLTLRAAEVSKDDYVDLVKVKSIILQELIDVLNHAAPAARVGAAPTAYAHTIPPPNGTDDPNGGHST